MKNIILTTILLLCSCTGKYTHKLDFNPSEPIRIAVLPFISVDSSGNEIEEESRLVVDTFSLISTDQKETPTQLMRKFTIAKLKNTGLDVVSPVLIDVELPHKGFSKPDGSIDKQKVFNVPAEKLCKDFVSCDAVLYGKITDWSRDYYGIQSVSSVAADIKIVSARTGKTIFSSEGSDAESRGITKIPTGFSSIVVEPIKGLDSDIIVDLGSNVINNMLAPLDAKQRPEFLESAPPMVLAASHSAKDGYFSKNEPLVVVMYGSDAQTASFAIGDKIIGIPMIERVPGHYYGEYVMLQGDIVRNEDVNITLTDSFGRSTTQTVPKGKVTLK